MLMFLCSNVITSFSVSRDCNRNKISSQQIMSLIVSFDLRNFVCFSALRKKDYYLCVKILGPTLNFFEIFK